MPNRIQLKRSAVAGKVPTTGDLQLGELALNTFDGKLYALKNNGTPSVVEIGATPNDVPPILETLQVLTDDYSITAGSNGLSVGPVEIQSGITVTIPSASVWRLI